MVNHGDTIYIELNYTVNGLPLNEYTWDDIEFMFGSLRFSLTGNTVAYDETDHCYYVFITQQQTFSLPDIIEYQLRLYKDNEVISTKVQRMPLGKVLSTTVLGGVAQ